MEPFTVVCLGHLLLGFKRRMEPLTAVFLDVSGFLRVLPTVEVPAHA